MIFFFFFFSCHRKLVRGFLKSAVEMLTENGEIHITHQTTHPFSKLEMVEFGEELGVCSGTTESEILINRIKA